MAVAIPFIVAAAAVASTVSAIQQSSAASKADKYNAAVAGQNAQIATDQANMQLQQQQTDTYRKLGALKAGYGASGVTNSGSPLDVLADSFTQSELDANTIIYNGKVRSAGYTNSANLSNASAANAKTAGYTKAASSMLLGATNSYSAFNTVGTSSSNAPATMGPFAQ